MLYFVKHFEMDVTRKLGLGGGDTYAKSINNSGAIVGASGDHAFLYQNGVMSDLGTLGGDRSYASCINNNGMIVGASSTAAGVLHAFSFQKGSMTDLGTLGGIVSSAASVNDQGVIVGTSLTSAPNTSHAFSFSNGQMTDLGAFKDGVENEAWTTGVNNNGLIIGSAKIDGGAMAVIYQNGGLTRFTKNLSWPGWGTVHTAQVNNNGNVVGLCDYFGGLRAFICYGTSDTGYQLPDLGGGTSYANGINNYDMVVGGSIPSGGSYAHAFLCHDGVAIDLAPYLVKAGFSQESDAAAINDAGIIVGGGVLTNGVRHAFALYPFTALTISTQPASQLGYWGKSVTFSITVTNGIPPYTYQWSKDGVAVPDATNSILVLTNLQATNAGVYSVVVSDTITNLTSPPAPLTVNPAGVGIALYPGVTIDGVIGQTYGIQMITNLANTNSWAGLTNITLTVPTQLWYDSQAATKPERYYRVLPGPISIP